MKKFFKYAIRAILVLLILLIGNSGMLFLWLVNSPREIPYLARRIEASFSGLKEGVSLKVGKAVVKWDGAQEGIGIHLQEVSVKDEQGTPLAAFPDVQVTLDFLSLMLGDITFRNVEISNPSFTIHAPAAPSATPKVEQEGPPQAVYGPLPVSVYRKAVIDILSAIERNNREIPVQDIRLRDIHLTVAKDGEENAWTVPELDMRFLVAGGVVTFETTMLVNHLGRSMAVAMKGFLDDKQVLHVTAKTQRVTPAFITSILPEIGWFTPLEVLLDADADMLVSPEGRVESVEFRAVTSKTEEPGLTGFSLTASGKLLFFPERGSFPEMHMEADLKNLPAPALQKFWPPEYGKNPREWLMPHVMGGVYDTGHVSINLTPEQIASGDVPEDAVKARFAFHDVDISYFEKFPALMKGKGSVVADANSAEITVDHAEFGDSFIPEGGKIRILDLDKDNVRMEVEGRLSGSLADLLKFQIMDKKALTGSLKPSAGKAETEYFVSFPLLANLDLGDILLRVKSELTDVAIEDVAEGVDLSGGKFHLGLEDNMLNVEGTAFIAKTQAGITLQEDYNEKRAFDQKYSVSSYLTPQEIPIPELRDALKDYLTGPFSLKTEVTRRDDAISITGTADLKSADMKVPEIGFTKLKDTAGVLDFALSGKSGKPFAVDKAQFTSTSTNIHGTGTLSLEDPFSFDLNFDTVRFGKNDLSLALGYDSGKKLYRTVMKGKRFDAAPVMASFTGNDSTTNDYAADLRINLQRLSLANGVELHDAKIDWRCNRVFCEQGSVDGLFGNDAALSVTYQPLAKDKGQTRQLIVRSADAGEVFRGFDIVTQMRGGDLEMSAVSDAQGKGLYDGKMIVKDFKAVRAPILGKLLALTSFTGLVDLLSGEGISFKKLNGQFAYDGLGQITLNDVEAAGNSIGLTLDGTVNTRTDQMKLDGAVIPAYSINSLLGDIPLIGDTLVGKKGEGIIATRYSIEGSYTDPDISVNPFSMLTPGFLRKIWGSNAAPENIPVPPVVVKPEKAQKKK